MSNGSAFASRAQVCNRARSGPFGLVGLTENGLEYFTASGNLDNTDLASPSGDFVSAPAGFQTTQTGPTGTAFGGTLNGINFELSIGLNNEAELVSYEVFAEQGSQPNNSGLFSLRNFSPTDGGPTDFSFIGSDPAAIITLMSGRDTVIGFGDGDTLSGYAGTDVIFGGAGNDLLNSGEDNDLVYGNQDADVIYGGRGADKPFGGQGADTLYGDEGDDLIVGNRGDDVLYGGGGADVFVFASRSLEQTVNDVIADFDPLVDIIASNALLTTTFEDVGSDLQLTIETAFGGNDDTVLLVGLAGRADDIVISNSVITFL